MLDMLSERGRERLGEWAGRLLSDPRFATAMQGALEATLRFRRGLENVGAVVLGGLGAPTRADVARMGRRVEELSELLDEVEEKLSEMERASAEAPAAPEPPAEAPAPPAAPKRRPRAAKAPAAPRKKAGEGTPRKKPGPSKKRP